MTILVTDPGLEERLKKERQAWGADRYDEVWEGIRMRAPIPNSEHQRLVGRLTSVLQEVVGWAGQGEVYPGVNVTDREVDWEQDYRVPDEAMFLPASGRRWVI